ncbi:hypothetical protein K501DRAFT_274225 [Backusella circina FSU 941]|nr:hypothetical protein K501DRAFT_274225 [Backusella circina FSU 941]
MVIIYYMIFILDSMSVIINKESPIQIAITQAMKMLVLSLKHIKPATDEQHGFRVVTTENFLRNKYKKEIQEQGSSSSSRPQEPVSSSSSHSQDQASFISSRPQELVQEIFYNKIEETFKTSLSYSANFGTLVYAIMMAMTIHCFVKDEDAIRLAPYNSCHISQFLLQNFQMEKDMLIPSPLASHTVLEDPDDALKTGFSKLFTQEHLQNIHSSYFGPKGVSEKTLKEHPLHRVILRLIPKDGTFPLKT